MDSCLDLWVGALTEHSCLRSESAESGKCHFLITRCHFLISVSKRTGLAITGVRTTSVKS
jgi:hypothetical protein